MAQTAVIAGTATAVSGGMQRHAAAKQAQAADAAAWQQQEQAAAMQAQAQQAAAAAAASAPAPAPAAADPMAQLQQLATMRQQGLLTDEEFASAKAKILG